MGFFNGFLKGFLKGVVRGCLKKFLNNGGLGVEFPGTMVISLMAIPYSAESLEALSIEFHGSVRLVRRRSRE